MRRSIKTILLPILLLAAGAALAVTEGELLRSASDLLGRYEEFESDVSSCPGGDCPEARDLLDEYFELEQSRFDLHQQRDALPGCGCSEVDELLDEIDAIAEALRGTLGEFDDQN